MSRGRAQKDRSAPERRCIATGETGGTSGLIRFVVAPDGQIVADVLGKLPGRGIWVSADRAALDLAVKRNLFARAAKAKVSVPPTLVDGLEPALTQRVIGLIALARKAGDAIVGYEKVKGWLDSGQAALLLQASDGSERGKSKLRPPDGPESYISVLTGSELGQAFGRENVIHGALAAGGLANRVVEEASRLKGLRPRDESNTALGKD